MAYQDILKVNSKTAAYCTWNTGIIVVFLSVEVIDKIGSKFEFLP